MQGVFDALRRLRHAPPAVLILASGSPRRREILEGLGVTFNVRTTDEEPLPSPGEAPVVYALRAARAKAVTVAATASADDWVLGADTVVAIGDAVLGKPTDDADAERMLTALSGRAHEVTTAFSVWRGGREEAAEEVTTQVTFAPLTPARIRRYVATGEGRDKAGAYAIQGRGMALVQSIVGSYSNVVGLPAAEVLATLERIGAVG
jgi:septum formation protein